MVQRLGAGSLDDLRNPPVPGLVQAHGLVGDTALSQGPVPPAASVLGRKTSWKIRGFQWMLIPPAALHSPPRAPLQPWAAPAAGQGGDRGAVGMAGRLCTPQFTLCSSQHPKMRANSAKSNPEDRNRNSFALLIT